MSKRTDTSVKRWWQARGQCRGGGADY